MLDADCKSYAEGFIAEFLVRANILGKVKLYRSLVGLWANFKQILTWGAKELHSRKTD